MELGILIWILKDAVYHFLSQVCGALLRGCLQYLAVLNLSRTVFSHRYEVIPAIIIIF